MDLNHLAYFRRMALDLLMPPRCLGCGREGLYICSDCSNRLATIKPPVCPRCVLPIGGGRRCDCHYWKALDGLDSVFSYQGVIRQAIIQLKYHNLRDIAPVLARYLQKLLAAKSCRVDCIVPVPLHKKRLRQRGYNQSELLARSLGELAGIEVGTGLERVVNTSSQVSAKTTALRRRNVDSAFSCRQYLGKKIMLVDDVATTGATLDACAQALKKAGAETVTGLTLAREI